MNSARKVLILYRNHHSNSAIAMRILFDKIKRQIKESISDEHESVDNYNPSSKLMSFTIVDRNDEIIAMPFELFNRVSQNEFSELYIDENCFEILSKDLFLNFLNKEYLDLADKRVFSVKNEIISIYELTNN